MSDQNKLSRLNDIEATATERLVEYTKSIRNKKQWMAMARNNDLDGIESVLFDDVDEVYDLLDDDAEKYDLFLEQIFRSKSLKK